MSTLRLIDRGRPRPLSGPEIQAMTADRVAAYRAARESVPVPVQPPVAVPLAIALGLFLCSSSAAFYFATWDSPILLFGVCGISAAASAAAAIVLALRAAGDEPSGAVTDRRGH